MAIALDSASDGTAGTTNTTASYSHTVVASNACLYVAIGFDDSGVGDHDPSCTYNSVSMTRIYHSGNPGSDRGLSVFRLYNPATGSNTVELSWTTGCNFAVCSVAYTGIDSTTPEDTPVSSEAVLDSITQAVSSAVDDLVLGAAVLNAPTSTNPTPTGTGHNGRALATHAQIGVRLSDLTGASPTATLTYTTDFEQWRVMGVNMNVAAGGDPPITDGPKLHLVRGNLRFN